jgi:thiol:disulfide interchange protein DsbD
MTGRLALLLLVAGVQAAAAQIALPRAELTPVPSSTTIAPGAAGRVAVKVHLPAGFHVQSDKPRDQFLIPTALTVKAPAGVSVDRIVYPKPSDLAQAGRQEPLAVFGADFSIDLDIKVAAGTSSMEVIVPAQLRYQACDDKVCYAPARADVKWTLKIVD